MPPPESRRRLWLLGATATALGALLVVKLLHRAQPRPAPAPPAPATPPARELAQPAPAPPPDVPSPAPSKGPDARDEANTMARIRAAVGPRPDEALALIDSLDREHRGGGPLAEERAALKVDALVSADRIGIARDAAEEFMRQYPHSPRVAHLEALTGVHPHPPEADE